jgi:hypothetical protein
MTFTRRLHTRCHRPWFWYGGDHRRRKQRGCGRKAKERWPNFNPLQRRVRLLEMRMEEAWRAHRPPGGTDDQTSCLDSLLDMIPVSLWREAAMEGSYEETRRPPCPILAASGVTRRSWKRS